DKDARRRLFRSPSVSPVPSSLRHPVSPVQRLTLLGEVQGEAARVLAAPSPECAPGTGPGATHEETGAICYRPLALRRIITRSAMPYSTASVAPTMRSRS